MVDTGQGIPSWADLISSILARHKIKLSHVLLTHWHGDHTGGVPDLIKMYPEVSSSIYKHTPSKTQQPILDGQVFKVDGATVRAVHSPGHSNDHMCFIIEEEQAMFTGDNVLGHGSSVVEHLRTWMDSLQVMQSHKCGKGYPAHGDIISDLKGKIESELAGRQRRERQIMQTLKERKFAEKAAGGRGKGSVTVKELVVRMHGTDVDAEVRELALEPFMEEVLRKLAEDGRVAFERRGREKKWFAFEGF